jgi:hypothetical protein
VTIEDSELYGFADAGIAFSNWQGYRLNIHDMLGDGVKLGDNVTLADSWIHGFTPSPGAHADGGQIQDGVTNVIIRNNTIDVPGTNAALFLAPDLGPSTSGPVLLDGNYLNGGGYTLFCVDGNNGQYFIGNITIRNNRFGTAHAFGTHRINVPVTWQNNLNDATGKPLSL